MRLTLFTTLLTLSLALPAQTCRVLTRSFRGGRLPALQLDGATWFNAPENPARVLRRGPTLVVFTALW